VIQFLNLLKSCRCGDHPLVQIFELNVINICLLKGDAGSCQDYTLMWFYDSKRGVCSRFWYGGCGGNKNRFMTQKECEKLCLFLPHTDNKNRNLVESRISCADFVQVWFFDKHIGACSPFWYGGCGGNANRFNTEHECFRTCVAHSKRYLVSELIQTCQQIVPQVSDLIVSSPFCSLCLCPDACFLSQDQGSCQNYSMMWFFDTEQNECARFWYGGCGGNENRFKTQEECENLCLTKSR
uniref:BPTI/Kunitz inhibitor domain-containing protein n=1 Tax=Stegastes partitus TaxID=144197 RepID=A0A3B5AYD5_9TELE